MGGTTRWMSPELFDLDMTNPGGARLTKQSDCYALGMVIYEVLSGQAPFTPFPHCIVIRKVIEGERPTRPEGPEGARFTNDLWQTLNQCWEPLPQRRPSAKAVLECLEQVPGALGVPTHQETAIKHLGNASNSFGMLSWSILHYSVALLCIILCLSQFQAITRNIPVNRHGGADVGESQSTTYAQDWLYR